MNLYRPRSAEVASSEVHVRGRCRSDHCRSVLPHAHAVRRCRDSHLRPERRGRIGLAAAASWGRSRSRLPPVIVPDRFRAAAFANRPTLRRQKVRHASRPCGPVCLRRPGSMLAGPNAFSVVCTGRPIRDASLEVFFPFSTRRPRSAIRSCRLPDVPASAFLSSARSARKIADRPGSRPCGLSPHPPGRGHQWAATRGCRPSQALLSIAASGRCSIAACEPGDTWPGRDGSIPTALMGFSALRSLVPARRSSDVSIRSSPHAVIRNACPGASLPGERPPPLGNLALQCWRPIADDADQLLGFAPAGNPVPARRQSPAAGRYCLGLRLSQVCGCPTDRARLERPRTIAQSHQPPPAFRRKYRLSARGVRGDHIEVHGSVCCRRTLCMPPTLQRVKGLMPGRSGRFESTDPDQLPV